MIILFTFEILCASNLKQGTENQKSNVEDKLISNLAMNPNPCSADFNHTFDETHVRNYDFNIGMIPNTNELCIQNLDSAGISQNLNNNHDKFYASEIYSQSKVNADNPNAITYTKHDDDIISFYKDSQFNDYNFYKTVNQTLFNENISSNSHPNLERQNNHNQYYQVLTGNKFYQSAPPDNNSEKYNERPKYPQNEEILPKQAFNFSNQNIFQFDESIKNGDSSKIQRNAEFDELIEYGDLFEIQKNAEFEKFIEFLEVHQELNKKDNRNLPENIIPLKRIRDEKYSTDINLNIANITIESNYGIQQQTEPFNIKSNIQNPTSDINIYHKLTNNDVKNKLKKFIIDKMITTQEKIYNESQLNDIPILPKKTRQTNDFSNIPSTSKTYSSFKNCKSTSSCNNFQNSSFNNNFDSSFNNNFDSPYDNDFDSPNFSLDLLNSYISDLNDKYLEKCENIFSVVVKKINKVLSQTEYEEKFSNSGKYKKNKKFNYYTKINTIVRIILKEILDEEIPIGILPNIFVNLDNFNLDLRENKNAEYNIFRTNKQENDTIISLISQIEQKYKSEANKIAKLAYDNFLKKINPFILTVMDEIYDGEINNKNFSYSNINSVLKTIHKSVNFTNEQLTEAESLIIYNVLKSISKFLKKTSEDLFLSQVFPELRIINILYHSRISDHHLSDRKFHAGIFLKNILKQKLNDFKDKYQSTQNIGNLDDAYSKEILEIRAFYIFNLFKFLNIKKPYLMAYILLSFKSYLLQNEKINYIEKNDFEKIFSLHVLNLDDIIIQYIFIPIKPLINKFLY
ncbi:hypothetical protein DMUE_2074 [Dictyocoela muelleri]|nr:hypothetical protein DMUE_2074 [Dictyocoela muelleri]